MSNRYEVNFARQSDKTKNAMYDFLGLMMAGYPQESGKYQSKFGELTAYSRINDLQLASAEAYRLFMIAYRKHAAEIYSVPTIKH